MENWNGRHGELDIRRLGPLQTTEVLIKLGGLFWSRGVYRILPARRD